MPFVCGVAWQSPNKRDCIKMSKIKRAASFQLLLLRCLLLFCRGRLFTRNACVVSACVRGLWHMRNSLSRVAIPSSVCPQRESQRLVRQPWRVCPLLLSGNSSGSSRDAHRCSPLLSLPLPLPHHTDPQGLPYRGHYGADIIWQHWSHFKRILSCSHWKIANCQERRRRRGKERQRNKSWGIKRSLNYC